MEDVKVTMANPLSERDRVLFDSGLSGGKPVPALAKCPGTRRALG
jgi:hypothetical protein